MTGHTQKKPPQKTKPENKMKDIIIESVKQKQASHCHTIVALENGLQNPELQ